MRTWLVGLAAIAAPIVAAAPASGAIGASPGCRTLATGAVEAPRLSVVGTQMRDPRGRVVRPYGVSLVGGPETRTWVRSESAAKAQIVAATRYWHANTVRLQVSEAQLLDQATGKLAYNAPFAASVDRLVCLILSRHAIPVINDMTLFTAKERGPTERTMRFWEFMSDRYGNRFPVIFDLFNEPRLTRDPESDAWLPPETVWQTWQSGGRVGGVDYVGMQALVDLIRNKMHVKNVIWAEEPYTYLMARRSHMDLLPDHLLTGDNIVYAFHKAQMDRGSPWLKALRDLTHRHIPLVDSEWAQYAATRRPWECYDDAYLRVPHYLRFLRHLKIGLIAWSLQPGSLVKGQAGTDTVHDGNDTRYTTDPADLMHPSKMDSSYGCTQQSLGQGAGLLIKRYFTRYSRRLTSVLFPWLLTRT